MQLMTNGWVVGVVYSSITGSGKIGGGVGGVYHREVCACLCVGVHIPVFWVPLSVGLCNETL